MQNCDLTTFITDTALAALLYFVYLLIIIAMLGAAGWIMFKVVEVLDNMFFKS